MQIFPIWLPFCLSELDIYFVTGGYDEYFGTATDVEAVVYMMIMNQLLHDLFPNIITVGEDVSGMPTFSR